MKPHDGKEAFRAIMMSMYMHSNNLNTDVLFENGVIRQRGELMDNLQTY